MSLSHADHARFVELLNDVRCGRSLADNEDWFTQQLANDEEAGRLYAESLWLSGALYWLLKGNQSPPFQHTDLLSPARSASPVVGFLGSAVGFLRRPVLWSILLVGVLFTGYVVLVSWNMLGKEAADGRLNAVAGSSDSDLQPSASDLPSEAAATITASEATKWQGASATRLTAASTRGFPEPITPGQPLSIQSGLVELQLKQGATLLIEGPADWSIDGDNNATLRHGKVLAMVPPRAHGFKLSTPVSSIIDLGTEFGVTVGPDHVSEVRVFKGRVAVSQTDHQRATSAPTIVAEGQGLKVSPRAQEQNVQDIGTFESLRMSALKLRSQRTTVSPRLRQDRVTRLQNDPSLLALYVCSQQPKRNSTLINLAPQTQNRPLNGQLMTGDQPGNGLSLGPSWIATIDRGSPEMQAKALLFKNPRDHVQFQDFDFGPQFTVCAWIYPERTGQRSVLLGNMHLITKADGFCLSIEDYTPTPPFPMEEQGRVVVTADNGHSRRRIGRSPPGQIVFRRWQHVAFSIDADRGAAKVFLNGVLVSDLGEHLHVRGFRTSGPWRIGLGMNDQFGFSGLMDEIAIFGRSLSEQDISRLLGVLPVEQRSTATSQER